MQIIPMVQQRTDRGRFHANASMVIAFLLPFLPVLCFFKGTSLKLLQYKIYKTHTVK